VRNLTVALPLVRGHRFGSGVVLTLVEELKLLDRDRGIGFVSKLRDGLADVAVAMNDLTDAEPHVKQLSAMNPGGRLHGFGGGGSHGQTLDQLPEEQRDAVLHLGLGGDRVRSKGDLRPGARDELVIVLGQKLVKHGASFPHPGPRCLYGRPHTSMGIPALRRPLFQARSPATRNAFSFRVVFA
jgi:hypothetical protein